MTEEHTTKKNENENADNNLDIEVYNSFDQIAITPSEWDGFIESQDGEFYLTYRWCYTWWSHYNYGRELLIFVFREDLEIVGILPSFLEHFGVGFASMNFLKIIGGDSLPITFSIPLNPRKLDLILVRLFDYLRKNHKWDVIYLGAISGKYIYCDDLIQAIHESSQEKYKTRIKRDEVQTYFDVQPNWDDQVKTLSSRQRTKTKRVFKEIQSNSINLSSRFSAESEITISYEQFVNMHQERWQSIGMPGHFLDWPLSYEFHKTLISNDLEKRVRLLEIYFDNDLIGYDYLFKFGNTYYWYLTARAKYENDTRIDFHRISFREKVIQSINENVKFIDGGRGYYEYKLVMGGRLETVKSVFIENNGLFKKLKIFVFYFLIAINNLIYSKIWRRRLSHKLRIKPKSLWRFWVRTHMLSPIDIRLGIRAKNN